MIWIARHARSTSAALTFQIALVTLIFGCQQDATTTQVAPLDPAVTSKAYASDIAKICDAVQLSGADKDPGGQIVIVANYLAAHLQTKESRAFMIRIQPLQGVAKAQALDDEAHKVGLPSCAVAELWRKPKTGP